MLDIYNFKNLKRKQIVWLCSFKECKNKKEMFVKKWETLSPSELKREYLRCSSCWQNNDRTIHNKEDVVQVTRAIISSIIITNWLK